MLEAVQTALNAGTLYAWDWNAQHQTILACARIELGTHRLHDLKRLRRVWRDLCESAAVELERLGAQERSRAWREESADFLTQLHQRAGSLAVPPHLSVQLIQTPYQAGELFGPGSSLAKMVAEADAAIAVAILGPDAAKVTP